MTANGPLVVGQILGAAVLVYIIGRWWSRQAPTKRERSQLPSHVRIVESRIVKSRFYDAEREGW